MVFVSNTSKSTQGACSVQDWSMSQLQSSVKLKCFSRLSYKRLIPHGKYSLVYLSSSQLTYPSRGIALVFLALTLEVSLAIIFVCIPPLSPYFRKSLDKIGLLACKRDGSSGAIRPLTIGHICVRRKPNDDSLFQDTQNTWGSVVDTKSTAVQSDWHDMSALNDFNALASILGSIEQVGYRDGINEQVSQIGAGIEKD